MASLTLTDLPEDFSENEKKELLEYIENGVPGMARVSDSDVFQWFSMYMAGQTFTEISIACKVNREKVLFIAHKSKWLDKRIDHISDIMTNLQEKAKSAKLESANTVMTMVSSFNKYYTEQFTKFLATGDRSIIEGMDTKLLGQYQKAIDAFEKILGNSTKRDPNDPNAASPLININMGGDSSMKQNDDGSVDITTSPPKEALGDILKLLAEAKKINDTGGRE